jgi:hypothetical protein
MRQLYGKTPHYLFIPIFMFCVAKGNCQVGTDIPGGNSIENLEASIGKKETIQLVQEKLEVLKQHAIGFATCVRRIRCIFGIALLWIPS